MADTVLIVEDDDAAREGLAQLLKGEGHDVLTAPTFEEGRRLLRTRHPDLLITDIRLGAFNGLQLIVGEPHRVPTIVMTAFSDHVLEAEARRLGAQFILKPIVPAQILELVDEMLGGGAEHNPGSRERPVRRWKRKPVPRGLSARVASASATVLDVSYGGLRLGLGEPLHQPLPPAFEVVLPEGALSVPVELVWQTYTARGHLECGVAVSSMNNETVRAWHGIVDAIAS